MPRRAATFGLCLAASAAGCYTNTPLVTPQPAPGIRVTLALSDVGRVGMAPSIGPSVSRIQGTVVTVSDTAYVLHVSDLYDIQGRHSQWTGETVQVPRAYVANAYERRLSRGRTFVAAGTTAALFVAFVLTRGLLGIGGSGNPGDGGPPNNQ